jgi:hypothetical protein
MPNTDRRCGGGSEMLAEVVSVERGSVDEGAEVSKSVYDMNESRFVEVWGEGGWERARGDTGPTKGEELCEIDGMGSGGATVIGVVCASVLAVCVTDPAK